jgi:ribosomal protein L37AE/L43A
MAMNRVQFQKGLSMAEFMAMYGTERQCEAALVRFRWPEGFCCPECRHTRATTFSRGERRYWQCARCYRQTSLTAGTIFESSKLPLTTWFLAMHLLTQAKNNVSALELKRHLGVSYPTAWLVKHKLMQVMAERENRVVLQGRVEIDDAYLGGERPGKTGRGSENKIPFLVAVQTGTDGKPERVCFKVMRFTKDGIQDWANRAIHADATVYSDALPSLKALPGRRTGPLPRHQDRQRPGRRPASRIPRGEHGPGQPQDRDQRHLPCLQLRQVRPTLLGGGAVPVQSTIQPESHSGTPDPRRGDHRAVSRASTQVY